MKLKIVIVDDDPFMVSMISDLCKSSPIVEVTQTYTNSVKFVDESKALDFDLAILDIEMPGMDGLMVRENILDKEVIFVTGRFQRMPEASNVPHTDVLSKPIMPARLNDAFEKAKRTILAKKGEGTALFTIAGSNGRKLKLKSEDVYYVGVDIEEYRHKHLYTITGEHHVLTDCTLEGFMEFAPNLLQANKAELVTKDAIFIIESDKVILKGMTRKGCPQEIVLGRNFKQNFIDNL